MIESTHTPLNTKDVENYFNSLRHATTQREFMRVARARKDWYLLADEQGVTVSMLAVQAGWSAWSTLLLTDDRQSSWTERDNQGRSLWFYALSSKDSLSDHGRCLKLLGRLQKGSNHLSDHQGRGLFIQWLLAHPEDLKAPQEEWGTGPDKWLKAIPDDVEMTLGARTEDQALAAHFLFTLLETPATPLTATPLVEAIAGMMVVHAFRQSLEGFIEQTREWESSWRAALAMCAFQLHEQMEKQPASSCLANDTWLNSLANSTPPPHLSVTDILTKIILFWHKDVKRWLDSQTQDSTIQKSMGSALKAFIENAQSTDENT